jgi:DNA-binding transcriptional LysR family regulator
MGALKINAARAAANMVLLPLVARFLEQHPAVSVELTIDEGLSDVVSAGFDAGVRFGETIAQDMVAVPLGPRQRTAIVASPEFLKRHKKPQRPEDLKDLPCIRFRFGSGRFYAWEFERGGIEQAIEVEGPLTLGDSDMMVRAALEGAGLAFAFEGQVEAHVAAGRLVRVLEDWCPYYSGFYLYYPSRRQVPAPLRAFIDFVKQAH